MATGANQAYWQKQHLPSMLKHTLLEKYVPQFAGMTGSNSKNHRVVFLDGYAGRGRYEDGTAGSAERVLQIARRQQDAVHLRWTCFFVEADSAAARSLQSVVREYAVGGLQACAYHADVADVLPDVLQTAAGLPLFLLLDPTGLGLPFDCLVQLLGTSRKDPWPPTELLLNFSLEGVRRIAGQVASQQGNEATMRRLDAALGGAW